MEFTVTFAGTRGAEIETFDNLDEALRYFRLGFAVGANSGSIGFNVFATQPHPEPEQFYFVQSGDSRNGDYITSSGRCSCPSFIYHGNNPCKHMLYLDRFGQYADKATEENYKDDMQERYDK